MDTKQHKAAYEEVQRDIEEMERQLDKLRTVALYHKIKAGVGSVQVVAYPATITASPPTIAPMESTLGRFANGIPQSKAAKIVLEEAGRPLKTEEIARRMMREGYHTADIKALKGALFTTMSRQKHTFAKAGRGIWTLQETDEPASDD